MKGPMNLEDSKAMLKVFGSLLGLEFALTGSLD